MPSYSFAKLVSHKIRKESSCSSLAIKEISYKMSALSPFPVSEAPDSGKSRKVGGMIADGHEQLS